MATAATSLPAPSRSAWLARISSVQQMTGASVLIWVSPVIMPTLSLPNASTRSKNFSETSALMGAV